MSKSLTIDMIVNADINFDNLAINEQIKRINEKLEKLPTFKVSDEFKSAVTNMDKSISKWIETEARLKETLRQIFPQIDAERFINIFIKGPALSGILDVTYYDKLFNMFIENYKNGHSDLISSITVVQPDINNEKETDSFISISSETLRSILIYLTNIIINVILAWAVNTATSDTDEIKSYLDQKFTENYSLIEDMSIKQDMDKQEIQNKINEYLQNQEEILANQEEIVNNQEKIIEILNHNKD